MMTSTISTTNRTIPFQSNSLNTTMTKTYDVGNSAPGLGQVQNVAGLNQSMVSQISLLDN